MRILFNEDFTEMAMLWEISRYGLVTISTVENECLGLGCNGAFPLFRIRVDTPHIELIMESYKDTFIEMKRTITQPKLSFLLPGT